MSVQTSHRTASGRPPDSMRAIHSFLSPIVPVKAEELESLLYSFGTLYCILAAYFLLLPLREDAGIYLGTSWLPGLFASSLVVTVIVAPLTSTFLARSTPQKRERALQQLYLMMAGVLLVFYVLYNLATLEAYLPRTSLAAITRPNSSSSSSGSSSSSEESQLPSVARRLLSRGRMPLKVNGGVSSLDWAGSSGASLEGIPVLQASQQQHQQQQEKKQPLQGKRQQKQQQQQRQNSGAFTHWDAAVHPRQKAWGVKSIPQAHQTNVQANGGIAWEDPGVAFASGMDSSSAAVSGGPLPQPPQVGRSRGSLGPGFRVEGSEKVFHQHNNKLWMPGGQVVVENKQQQGHQERMLQQQPHQRQRHRKLKEVSDAVITGASSAGGTRNGRKNDNKDEANNSSSSSTGSSSSSSSMTSGATADDRSPTSSTTSSSSSKTLKMLEGDLSLSSFQRILRACFYVWVSAMNLIGISSLWATCADVFSPSAGARLFGCISAGATLGQLFGSLVAVMISHAAAASAGGRSDKGGGGQDGEASSPVSALLLASMGMQLLAAWSAPRIRRSAPAESGRRSLAGSSGGGSTSSSSSSSRASSSGKARAQQWHAQLQKLSQGFRLILSSRYLLVLCSYLMMTYVVGSLLYFQRALVVSSTVSSTAERTNFFATLNSWSAAIIALLQLLATSGLLRLLGVPVALLAAPGICLVGLGVIMVRPVASSVAAVEVVRKVFGYAVNRPAREVLFTVVSREEKYSAKLVIDTVVQRCGDVIAAAVFQVLEVQLHLGPGGVGVAGCVMCLVWAATAISLGRSHTRLARAAGKQAVDGLHSL